VSATLYQKVEIFNILGPRSHPVNRLAWNFVWPSGPTCPWSCQISRESVQRVTHAGRKCWFLACD